MILRALLLGGLLATSRSSAAPPETIVELEDPPGDASGPGTFLAPSDSELSVDDFDLRRFVVRVDGEQAVFEITVGALVRAPSITQRTNVTPLELTSGLYVQNIDIYLDTDPTPGSGHAMGIPGRRIAFADGHTWEKALVLTPQPASARAVVEGSLGDAAADVLFPRLTVQGKKIIARVPLARLGGRPRADWGYSVQLSGSTWERNFNLLERVKGGAPADALTMPVLPVRERWAFGGGDGTRTQTQIIDVILPAGKRQEEVLSGSDDATGTFAEVPFVYPTPRPPPPAPALADAAPGAPAPPPPPAGPTVSDVLDEVISISGAPEGLPVMAIGQVLGPDDAVIARLVVVQTVKGGVVASALDHKERIVRGARVRFPLPRTAPAP